MARTYQDARHAIRAACGEGPACVGWSQLRKVWIVYDPKEGAPRGTTPEFFCVRTGMLPIPLSEEGLEIMIGLLTGEHG